MNIHALIPARGGSKRIPDKNIVLLDGFPLLAYSIAQSKLSSYVNDIVVTTDSKKIASVARSYGADVPFLRPAEISTKDSLDIEFFKHYLHELETHGQSLPELILFLRPTTPLRTTAIVDGAIQYMIDHPEATGLRSMHKIPVTPYKLFKNNNGYAEPFLDFHGEPEFHNFPRQRFEDTFIGNGCVDVVRTKTLKESGLLFGERIKIWETERTPDIDTPKGLLYAAQLLEEKKYHHLLDYLKKTKLAPNETAMKHGPLSPDD